MGLASGEQSGSVLCRVNPSPVYTSHGQAGNGKLRQSIGQKRSVKETQKYKKNQYNSGVATSGLVSSFAFTPMQEIDLMDPQAEANRLASGIQSRYFS